LELEGNIMGTHWELKKNDKKKKKKSPQNLKGKKNKAT
jgi:hypothetical protein